MDIVLALVGNVECLAHYWLSAHGPERTLHTTSNLHLRPQLDDAVRWEV